MKTKKDVVLSNKEKIVITTADGHIRVIVTCIGNTLHIEEQTKNNLPVEDEEMIAIKAMKKYLRTHKNDR